MTVTAALHRASHVGCAVRLRGAKVTNSHIQNIERTSVDTQGMIAWINPLCHVMADPGPGINEPAVTPGPTELVSGLFVEGGPLVEKSAPNCRRIVGMPLAGTILVDDATGALIASAEVTAGQLATIPLPPGAYTVSAALPNGGETPVRSVTVLTGDTVRADAVLPVP